MSAEVYRTKRYYVEAIQWRGDNWDDISKWVYGEVVTATEKEYEDGERVLLPVWDDPTRLSLIDRGSESIIQSGDWVIRDASGTLGFVAQGDFAGNWERDL